MNGERYHVRIPIASKSVFTLIKLCFELLSYTVAITRIGLLPLQTGDTVLGEGARYRNF